MVKKATILPRLATIFALLFIPSFILNGILLYREKTLEYTQGVGVISVYDGDTLILENKERLRLRQLDAPELELCGGQEAKKKLEELVSGKRVWITEQIPDQQGRGMALVYARDTLVNKELLAGGFARYHSDKTSQTEALKRVADDAKGNNLGLYGTCQSMTNTKNPNCTIKGNIDRTRKTYHMPGCTQYPFAVVEEDVGEQWFCTEKEAQAAGYIKSERCP
ncbi:thermonuclease family protein [Candidatus Gottesmanbacteria bacterium]|nr:thermonuclease family protein [Candidatus Gottesmanbacteria bacterium]